MQHHHTIITNALFLYRKNTMFTYPHFKIICFYLLMCAMKHTCYFTAFSTFYIILPVFIFHFVCFASRQKTAANIAFCAIGYLCNRYRCLFYVYLFVSLNYFPSFTNYLLPKCRIRFNHHCFNLFFFFVVCHYQTDCTSG